jgi:TPP-dependent pyruvate/acetoin dehydrogenase alpha subunit
MTSDTLKRLYAKMLRIRRIEETIADAYPEKHMRCPVHLSIGQEAVPVGLCDQLGVRDHIYSTHRCHAHYLAKEGRLPEMIAELYGKVTGCCKGRGGSMHLVQASTGMMGSSAIVAGTIPLAVGSAFAMAAEKSKLVSVAFFGDGASEEGIFYEALNFASLRKLPVIFACENNQLATYSPQSARQASTDIAKRAHAFDMASATVDGNDVEAVYRASEEAIARARSGKGPTLLEFKTYRWRDHVGPTFDYHVGFRSKEDVEEGMKSCPIESLEKKLLSTGAMTAADKGRLEDEIKRELAAAFKFAADSPFPQTSEIFNDIYA